MNILDSDEQQKEEEIAMMKSADDSGKIVKQGVVNLDKEEPEAKIEDDGTDKNKNTEDTENPKDVDKTQTDTKEDSEIC